MGARSRVLVFRRGGGEGSTAIIINGSIDCSVWLARSFWRAVTYLEEYLGKAVRD
jgi:hypothetical protein